MNCFAAYLLTDLLEPSASDTYRVVNISSKLHSLIGSQSVASLSPPVTDGSTYFDYALSKAGQVMHTGILNKRYSESNQKYKRNRLAFSVEPGLIKTKIMRESSDFTRWLNYLLLYPILKVFASVSLSVFLIFDIILTLCAYLYLLNIFFTKDIDQGCSSTMYCLLAPGIPGGFYVDCCLTTPSYICNNPDEIKSMELKFNDLLSLLKKCES